MLLTYVDESYTDDWYYMAALLCDGPGAQKLTVALDRVMERAVREYGVPEDAELHGHELFGGKERWKDIPPRVRIWVYNQAFDAIATHCEAIIIRGMHVAGLRKRYIRPEPPHSVVLQHLLERVDDYMREEARTWTLVIADEVSDQARHRSDLLVYRTYGTTGYRSTKLTRVIDTLHFAPSRASRLLQAVDMVAFLRRRMRTHKESHERVARENERLWQRIQPKVWHDQCWLPIPWLP